MSAHKHTPGPWRAMYSGRGSSIYWSVQATAPAIPGFCGERSIKISDVSGIDPETSAANARLIAAAPELLEALREAVDLAWIPDSRIVEFDPTVRFGPHYDYAGLDESTQRQEFHGQYECIVWPGRKWSAYCTYEGSLWFEQFDTAAEAKEKCMALLDRLIPEHPAMKARAAIAKATGEPA